MINVSTLVSVIDNSGVSFVRCIRLLRGSKLKSATVGNCIVGVVFKTTTLQRHKKIKSKKSLTKGSICKGLIVGVSQQLARISCGFIKSSKNSIILISDNFLPVASRIAGPVYLELRKFKQLKILTLAFFIC